MHPISRLCDETFHIGRVLHSYVRGKVKLVSELGKGYVACSLPASHPPIRKDLNICRIQKIIKRKIIISFLLKLFFIERIFKIKNKTCIQFHADLIVDSYLLHLDEGTASKLKRSSMITMSCTWLCALGDSKVCKMCSQYLI